MTPGNISIRIFGIALYGRGATPIALRRLFRDSSNTPKPEIRYPSTRGSYVLYGFVLGFVSILAICQKTLLALPRTNDAYIRTLVAGDPVWTRIRCSPRSILSTLLLAVAV